MGKVSIKKNVKPKTMKQKQKQTQNVTVNIGSISKKRGRPKRQPVKKPIQQPTSQPIVSYNQPIFKQSNPQPSSLASSILATQATPKVVAEEVKDQSSLRKALLEQNTDEPATKVNDLERVRSERLKKFEKPAAAIVEPVSNYSLLGQIVADSKKEIPKENLYRIALLSQSLADQQDDTEEIQALKVQPAQPSIPFASSDESFATPAKTTSKYVNALRGLGLDSVVPSRELLSKSGQRKSLLDFQKFEAEREDRIQRNIHENAKRQATIDSIFKPDNDTYFDSFVEVEQEEETPLQQPEQRGAAEIITETPSEPTPLSQPSVEMGFGGLSEEPIQTSVGQILPPEPVSQNELIIKRRTIKLPSLLKAVEPPPPITEPQETAPTILEGLKANEVRAADQYTTEQLVKDEPAGGAPLAEAEVIEQPSKIPSESKQIEAKWQELKDAKLIKAKRTFGGERRPINELLSDINSVSGNETYRPITKPNKPGPKLKPTIAEEIQVIDV